MVSIYPPVFLRSGRETFGLQLFYRLIFLGLLLERLKIQKKLNQANTEDMLDFYMPFILQECKNAYKGLEWEERVEVGKEALLYSIHTYNSRSERFPDYFLAQLKRILKQKMPRLGPQSEWNLSFLWMPL